jgi:hypothetical protein
VTKAGLYTALDANFGAGKFPKIAGGTPEYCHTAWFESSVCKLLKVTAKG